MFIRVFWNKWQSREQEKTFISKVCSNPPKFNFGDKVELLVNLNKPNDSPVENEWFALWGGSVVLGMLSALLGAFGILGLSLYKYKTKTKNLRNVS